VQAAAVMVETRAARAEMMAQERLVLLATAHSEANEAAQRVSTLDSELMTVR
jgi:hypothetical protein